MQEQPNQVKIFNAMEGSNLISLEEYKSMGILWVALYVIGDNVT